MSEQDDNKVYIISKIIENITPWNKLNERKYIKTSIGTLINIKNKTYILTCFHGIKNAVDINCYKKNNNKISIIKAKQKIISEELDLGLLEIENIIINTTTSIDTFDIKNKNNKLTMEIIIMERKEKIDLIRKKYNFKEYIETNKKINCYSMPEIPYIEVENNEINDDIKGASGTPIYNDNKIIGILNSMIDNKLLITSYKVIKRFLKEYIETDNFKGLCDILIDKTLLELNDNQYKIGYLITTILKKKDTEEFILKDNDIICSINNNIIESDGKINGIYITEYITLHNYINKELIVKIYRLIDNKYRELDIKITLEPISINRILPIIYDNNYFNMDGMIFIELTEEHIEYYINRNKILVGNYINKYQQKPFNDKNNRCVIFYDIIRSNFNDIKLLEFDRKDLPMIKLDDDKITFLQLVKVNDVKIKNLKHFKKNIIFKNNDKIELYLKSNNTIKYKLNIINNNLKII